MELKDNLKRNKDGSYILKSRSTAGKKGTCIECGENSETRELLFRYKQDDLMLVQNHMEDHLTTHSSHESITPIWCSECNCLLEYNIRMNNAT